jgi:copper chaperone CopZ
MTQTFQVTGMTCAGCEAKVKYLIGQLEGVSNVDASHISNEVNLTTSRSIAEVEVSAILPDKYKLIPFKHKTDIHAQPSSEEKSWLETYKPILLVFFYILLITILVTWNTPNDKFETAMNTFMAGFFIIFSFFKILNLKGFAESYAMYDVVTKRFPIWGFIYPFVELGLGISFIINCCPLVTNILTLFVMSISSIGVIQSVINKKAIKCACLGTGFNLPMSTVTIIEDGIMILMSAVMILKMIAL